MQYELVGEGVDRAFSITGGLQEGYGPTGKLHTLPEVIEAHHRWQNKSGRPMGVLISEATASYGWPQDGAIHSDAEPGWVVGGSVTTYDAHMSDTEVLDRLVSLAKAIGEPLGQKIVYVRFAGLRYLVRGKNEEIPSAVDPGPLGPNAGGPG